MLFERRDKAKDIFGIERWVMIVHSASMMFLPAMFIRWIFGRRNYAGRKYGIEGWALYKPLLFYIFLINGYWWTQNWVCWLVALLLADMFFYVFGLVILKDFWIRTPSYSRSLILLGINFLEFTLGFAIFYLHYGLLKCGTDIVHDCRSALYFSVVTSATVGYGDIVPASGPGRNLATTQILLTLGFMTVVISSFVSNLGKERTEIRDG